MLDITSSKGLPLDQQTRSAMVMPQTPLPPPQDCCSTTVSSISCHKNIEVPLYTSVEMSTSIKLLSFAILSPCIRANNFVKALVLFGIPFMKPSIQSPLLLHITPPIPPTSGLPREEPSILSL
ncbi:hypothetical protein H5410_048105 [Solanum commersonii]|uniref:Uncharacterized protein n=1 Tax=Solanum commersonii TaxID=4109 RepID=A0A9J5XJD8_SOLCO|nr:hypothetical protein H5410_048105 [Solanum commersonii]